MTDLLPERPHQAAVVYATVAALAQERGPQTDRRFVLVLELGPQVFSWALYDTTDADGVNVIAPSGGAVGRWKRARYDERGEDLADADQALTVAGGRLRVLPPATLTDDRTLTLDDAGAAAGDQILITRNDVSAFTATIVNGGAGGGNVAVMPVSVRSWCLSVFDGTNWIHAASGLSLAAS
jgi:hypothetical protein